MTGGDAGIMSPLPFNIAELIAEKILAGELRPGDRLLEDDLARQFQTSRAPIREAFYLLQLQGLIERIPRRGTLVRKYTVDDIQQIYQTRVAIETLAVDRIESAKSSSVTPELRNLLTSMHDSASRGDFSQYSLDNSRFHQAIVAHGGETIILGIWRQLNYPLRYLLRRSTHSAQEIGTSLAEHESLVVALEQKDFPKVKELLKDNIIHGMHRVIGEYFETTSPEVH